MARRKPQAFFTGFLVAGALSGVAVAQEPNPEPNTYIDVSVPQLTRWNTEANTLTVQPGVDGYSGASARTQFYPSATTRDTAEAAIGGSGDVEGALWAESPAAVYWELDNGSGRAPGIQAVTDDLDFPTNNCIMASGEIVDDELGVAVPKTCSDSESSSKRYFLEIRTADQPVDMVFDVGLKDIRYKGVKSDDGGEELAAFREEYGIGRIYRVIQKVINNSDERWMGVEVELGHGVGDDFTPFNFAQDGVAFELRPLVPREFFEGETGAPDIEVWDTERFSTFSPKAFDTGERARFDPGFFSDQAAGLFPPQDVGNAAGDSSDKTTRIASGVDFNAETGALGAVTQNFFSMADLQAAGTGFDDGSAEGIFGYWLSDSLAPFTIARYDEGIPDGESDALEAWWDGSIWRYGQAGDAAGLNSFGEVDPSQLAAWAEKLLGTPTTDTDKVRYASILADDLAVQNMDVYIYISDGILDGDGNPKYDNITMRVTAVSTAGEGLTATSLGNATPAWVDPVTGENTAPDLATYRAPRPAPEALNDSAQAVGVFPVEIDLMENDVLNGALLSQRIADGDVTADYTVVGNPANGTVSVNAADGQATYTASSGFAGQDTFTYQVEVTDTNPGDSDDYDTDSVSNTATVTIQVVSYPEDDAPIAQNDSAVTFINTPVTIDVLDNDSRAVGGTLILDNDPLNGNAVIADGKVLYTPASGFTGLDRFSYTVTVNGKESNSAVITVRVDEPTDSGTSTDEKEGGGTLFGCSYNPGAPFDPTLPLVALAALGGLVIRNRRKQTLH
ncbi:choice-of-anchor F family protein [Marinobacter sp. 1_MG-2023]|uniref:choice-of-anchor F family protein n=1 Tax=Marinobacter sp. 1_MG-2023 TaxID=3062627 RepID=UPI0026E23E99|nr:choice-of-anchor F family protein [Marinobacter sp. 1_MG-2023]MDO6822994.1 choice-of-anchor F family protein [Marinobacter sp. 1_MG-2023]